MPSTAHPATEASIPSRAAQSTDSGGAADLALTQRRLIDGYAARVWMNQRGWDVDDNAGFRIYVDEIATTTFRLARIWHTAAVMRLRTLTHARTPAPPPSGTMLILQIEGRAHLNDETVDPGGMAVMPANASAVIRVEEPTARIEIVFSGGTHPWISQGFPRTIAPDASRTASWAVLTSLANALLNAPTAPTTASFPWLRDAAEHAAAALLAERDLNDQPLSRTAARDGLVIRADALIRENAHDPDFSIEELATRLSVSRRHLTRLLTAQGASPRERLRRARTTLARNLLDGTDPRPWNDKVVVARLSGFTSTRALADALAHDETGPSSPDKRTSGIDAGAR